MQMFREFLTYSDSRVGKLLLVMCLVWLSIGRVCARSIAWVEKPFLLEGDEESEMVRPWFWFFLTFCLVMGVFIVSMYNQNRL